MGSIKLLEIEGVKIKGKTTRRFQSQIHAGTDSADFVMSENNVMKHHDYGDKGFNFYPYNKTYEIVSDIKEMNEQQL